MVRGHIPTPGGWLGILLVTGSCILIPFETLRGLSLRTYINRTTVWMLVTALGTTGYTLVDKYAAEAVRSSPAYAALYGYLFFVVSAVVYSLLMAVWGKLRQDAGESVGWKRPLAAAVLDAGGYWLILWVYQLTQNAGYVMAFRQFSILVGVVLGVFWFRERNAALRLLAGSILVAGLILVRLCG
jgi:drug/metabolite transporter (DMT)-like permease